MHAYLSLGRKEGWAQPTRCYCHDYGGQETALPVGAQCWHYTIVRVMRTSTLLLRRRTGVTHTLERPAGVSPSQMEGSIRAQADPRGSSGPPQRPHRFSLQCLLLALTHQQTAQNMGAVQACCPDT